MPFLFAFTEELKEHFGKFGEIENVTLKSDPNTGRSRGFAFIVFKDTESLEKVSYLCSKCHYLLRCHTCARKDFQEIIP